MNSFSFWSQSVVVITNLICVFVKGLAKDLNQSFYSVHFPSWLFCFFVLHFGIMAIWYSGNIKNTDLKKKVIYKIFKTIFTLKCNSHIEKCAKCKCVAQCIDKLLPVSKKLNVACVQHLHLYNCQVLLSSFPKDSHILTANLIV